MLTSPLLYYLNPLFDLELGGFPTDRVRNSAIEMSPLFSLVGTANDRVLLDVDVPEEYFAHLSENGLSYSPPLDVSEKIEGFAAIPWGWNESAKTRLASLGATCTHPDFAVIEKVNGRKWCARFNHESNTGVFGSRFCATEKEVDRAREELAYHHPIIAKPAFGSTGHGFFRIDEPSSLSDDIINRKLARMLDHGGMVIEPWCDRIADLSSSCAIGQNGSVANLRHYRCDVSAYGTFRGVTVGFPDPFIEAHGNTLTTAALKAAAALADSGYFGPASFDSFVYRRSSTNDLFLAPVIEVNARHGMSAIAFALHERIGDDRICAFRLYNRRRLELPDSYPELADLLGGDAYDPATREGILLVSPLRIRHGESGPLQQPARSALLLAARGADELHRLSARF